MVAVAALFWGVVSAITVKLASSIDDVLWLAPFLTSNVFYTVRWQNAVVYLSVCMIQTVVAMIIARSGSDALKYLTKDAKNAWSIDKILTVSAGTLLALYAVKLTYEFFTEEDDDDGEDGNDADAAEFGNNNDKKPDLEANVPSQVELTSTSADKGLLQKDKEAVKEAVPQLVSQGSRGSLKVPESDQQERVRSFERTNVEESTGPERQTSNESTGLMRQTSNGIEALNRRFSRSSLRRQNSEGEDRKRQQTLFMIAFIGSVDDLTLFVPMLVGKSFNWFELMSGAFVAGGTIVLLCVFIGLCKPIADCLAKIPLALIVGVFAIVLITKAFLMD